MGPATPHLILWPNIPLSTITVPMILPTVWRGLLVRDADVRGPSDGDFSVAAAGVSEALEVNYFQ